MTDNLAVAQAIALHDYLRIQAIFSIASAALLGYDYIITLDSEVDLFWKRKFNVSSVLFEANRYLACAALQYTPQIIEVLQYLPWAWFSAIRAYVLSSRSRALASLVFLLSIAPLAINYVNIGLSTIFNDGPTCTVMYKVSTSTAHHCAHLSSPLFHLTSLLTDPTVSIISRSCLISADFVVLAITLKATYRHGADAQALGRRRSLWDVLYQDGLIYFAILLVTNILHLTFTLLSIATQTGVGLGSGASVIPMLSDPITANLVSRFLIDLKEADCAKAEQESISLPSIGRAQCGNPAEVLPVDICAERDASKN
ncbi:hypothetical protein C8Q76DRAFT_791152 [Earliella scabrosa]|nr:hypothetical protein C8Q76DRAFT_791152 [Earliella scabrosa]